MAAAPTNNVTTHPVRHPQWILTYAGTNISADITAMVTSITYVDILGGGSGSVEVKLEDRDKRWQGPWYPTQGDLVNLQIGYAGESLLPCGEFQVDQLELQGPPDTFHLKCIAAGITPALRTPTAAGYENQTLTQIANTIAALHGLTVVGLANQSNPAYDRVTQSHETDLAFLKRLAEANNYEFTIRGKQLVFYARPALEKQPPIYNVTRTQVTKFHFKNRTQKIFKLAQVSYQNPATKALVTQTVAASPAVATGDTLKMPDRAPNGQIALQLAQSALHQHNMMLTTGTMTLPGATVLVAGNNLAISGFGVSDGTYLISKATHRLERESGYSTEVEIRRIA